MNAKPVFNGYKIKWTIIELDKNPSKKLINQIKKIRYFTDFYDNGLYYCCGDSEEFTNNTNNKILEILKQNNRTGRLITITDEQFGLSHHSTNNEKGILEDKGKIFKAQIFLNSKIFGARTFPVTTKQIENAIYFKKYRSIINWAGIEKTLQLKRFTIKNWVYQNTQPNQEDLKKIQDFFSEFKKEL